MIFVFVLELLLVGVYVFGDIGFDHPGRYGLDYSHFLILAAIFVLVWLVGTVAAALLAAFEKKWAWLPIQLLLPVALYGYETFPGFVYDAANYQHFVGKTRAEMKREFGSPRGSVTGYGYSNGVSREFHFVRGMEIHYDHEGIVVEVKPHPER